MSIDVSSIPADELLRLDNQICFAIYTSSRLLTRAYGPLLDEFDITYPQYLALLVLWEGDGLPVHELGKRLFLDSGTLTPLLKRLETKGLVLRQRSPNDERVVRAYLTQEGRALKQRIVSVPTALLQQTSMSAEALIELKHSLDSLIQQLSGLHPKEAE